MQAPEFLTLRGGHGRYPAMRLSADRSQRSHRVATATAAIALAAGMGLMAVDDTRSLPAQRDRGTAQAGEAVHPWRDQLERGLQVSLRAVADGNEFEPRPPRTPS